MGYQPSSAEWVTIESEETITVIEDVEVSTTVTTKVLTPELSGNLSSDISNYSTSGDASTTARQGSYCSRGDACTGYQGGAFSTSLDLENEMSITSINEGFDLNYGVTVKSHNSNTTKPTCDQTNGDCKDSISVTMILKDGNSVVHQYQNEYILDYGGTQNYTFTQEVPTNTYSGLIAELELYGIDAGYHKGMYGPIFSDPYVNVAYDIVSFINETVINIVQQEVENIITVYDQVWIPEPEIISESNEEIFVDTIEIEIDTGSGDTVEMNFDIDVNNATGDITIEVETVDEFGVEEVETIAEIEIAETEMSVEVAEEEISESIESEVTEKQTAENSNNDKPIISKTEIKQKIQQAKQKIATKILSTITNNYNVTSQNTQIALMSALTDTQTFKDYQSQSLTDIEGFFTEIEIPDNAISDNNISAYFMFGGSDMKMNELIESQYK